MKKAYLYILLTITSLLLSSCMKENENNGKIHEGDPVDLVLNFGAENQIKMTVGTKSTLTEASETKIYNMYIFIFNKGGSKIYGKYFDASNLVSGSSTSSDYWTISYDSNGTSASGTIHMKTTAQQNCTICAIANIDADMVNISPELLSAVQTKEDLDDMVATLNQEIVNRNGYFPMSGALEDVNTGSLSGTLVYRRLDAKIIFTVRVAAGSKIANFTPLKWQVCNVPKSCYIMEHGTYVANGRNTDTIEDAGSSDSDFFNTTETNYEASALTNDYYPSSTGTGTGSRISTHSFSFYMMENRLQPKSDITKYAQRELQVKSGRVDTGTGTSSTVDNGEFEYANAHSTYVKLTGRVEMANSSTTAADGATLNAEVTYYVHLGDFGDGVNKSDWNNFDTFRNHTYTYNITIEDVEDIRVEVQNNYDDNPDNNLAENEPGAEGTVTVALETIYNCDAHYCSQVINFHAKNIKSDNVTWMVKTPFNPNGRQPVVVNGVDVTAGIDYEWVEFRVNKMDQSTGMYKNKERREYKPRGYKPSAEEADDCPETMNVSELVTYLKDQKLRYEKGLDNAFDNDPDGPKITVTAFVNEYYYEKNPVTGETPHDLWKSFVNQPMRVMHILSDTKISADKQSTVIGSAFTIQQSSIQSIYNNNSNDLNSVWGCEHVDDELENGGWAYNDKLYNSKDDRGNTSRTNGRLNTYKEWGVDFEKSTKWSEFLDLTADNEVPLLNDTHQYLRYSCMSRNRDNNGNGVIDQDEYRWYMGSINQLIGLYIGGYGIDDDARIYQRTKEQQSSTTPNIWRQHVISSTQDSREEPDQNGLSNNPLVVWGEQGCATNGIHGSYKWAHMDKFSTRCIRNVGYVPDKGDITYSDINVEPDDYIVVKRMKNGVETSSYDESVSYDIDCSRVNEQSLRYFTSRELDYADENSLVSCLPHAFATAPVDEAIKLNSNNTIDGMNKYLSDNLTLTNPFCPSGYRLPNVREACVMLYYIPDSDFWSDCSYALTRTYWSFGPGGESAGTYKSGESGYGYAIDSGKVVMCADTGTSTSSIRCVKDTK